MTPREILAKYGLKTDVKSIRERLYGEPHFHGLVNAQLEESLKTYSLGELLRLCRQADLDLLCEMAEKVEKIAEVVDKWNARGDAFSFDVMCEIEKILKGEKE